MRCLLVQLREKDLMAAEETVTALSGTREAKVDKYVAHLCSRFIKLSVCD